MTGRRIIAVAVAVVVVATSVVLARSSEAVFGRSFVASVRGFPVEPDPGQNQQPLGFRPVAVEGGLASAPMGANGRAALFDFGFTENLPDVNENNTAFARCDTVSQNVAEDEVYTRGPMRLSATCTEAPSLDVRADAVAPAAVLPPEALEPLGVSGGLVSSWATADASGTAVVGETRNRVVDLDVGPLHIEEMRFRARAEANGEPGGAKVEWSVDALSAEVDGVPVVIGTGGVRVDERSTPAPLLSEVTAGIQEGFARSGGFIDVRVLEPQRTVADDGSFAEVRGGGLHIFLSSGDNVADRYFVGLTIGGGLVRVEAGELRTGPSALSPFVSGGPRVGGLSVEHTGGSTPVGAARSQPAIGEVEPLPAAAPVPRVSLTTTTTRRSLARASSWWVVALVGGLAMLALAAASSSGPLLPARRRAEGWWDVASERFLRG